MQRNKDKYNNNISTLYWSIYYSSHLLLYLIFIVFLYYILEYESYIVYCDSIGNSDEFFLDNLDESKSKYSNNTDAQFLDSYSDFSDTYECSNILNKYKNIGKRKIAWYIIEKDKGNFSNYKEYKKSWDPNINILLEIRKQVKLDIHKASDDLVALKDKGSKNFSIAKRTLTWFISSSKPGGGRGL